ncbi:16S rRNA (cytosine(967)-C(5))-methyltransferase RsmB [Pokkaliibacter sp. CJK22405]|uniref:16S rRNA (cytosine(967)-C(5))-methyltransferase RsmB n=1 Tax=Pokkaliibacter sp. CJK22405 TaxID=3384615 RepID=UPI0039852549
MNARHQAVEILLDVLDGGLSLTAALSHAEEQEDTRDQGLVQEICYGVMRWLPRLQCITDALLVKRFKRRDIDVNILVMVGLYQLEYMRVPSHAAISQTVEVCRNIDKHWATGLVNGVLRRYEREKDEILEHLQGKSEFDYAHPAWMTAKLSHAWPEHWQQIIAANNDRPPMTLRVNVSQISRDDYLTLLTEAEIAAVKCQHSPFGLTLSQPMDVSQLPGFEEGLVSVQDEAAQLAAPLLDTLSGRVLDACCAPGGKTAHLLELAAAAETELEVQAMDIEPHRLMRTQDTLERLGLGAELIEGDAATQEWWDGQPFDAILADVPCSATGVIRRHPDIKSLRTSDDILALASLQLSILDNLWQMLAPGGTLVYATCSILPQENNRIIERFMKQHEDATCLPIEAAWGIEQPFGRQLFPTLEGHDGFFYARLAKA